MKIFSVTSVFSGSFCIFRVLCINILQLTDVPAAFPANLGSRKAAKAYAFDCQLFKKPSASVLRKGIKRMAKGYQTDCA